MNTLAGKGISVVLRGLGWQAAAVSLLLGPDPVSSPQVSQLVAEEDSHA
jgi:hypothetical protein